MSDGEDPAEQGDDQPAHDSLTRTSNVGQWGPAIEAHANGEARQYIAGRDVHVHLENGIRGSARRLLSASDAGGDVSCPYPGLAPFGTGDARWFFGRDRHLAELTSLLDTARGPVVLVAPSGAGKSSLLRAGLIPALEQGALPDPGSRSWPRLLMTPTSMPIAALANQIAAETGLPAAPLAEALRIRPDEAGSLVTRGLAEQGTVARIVLIIDQFEELFALCEDEAERRAFVTALDMLTKPSWAARSAALVVLGLRADFYAQAASYPELRAALQSDPLLMGPMTRQELRQAIVFPAHSAGLELEPGLVEVLLRDLGAAERDEDPKHGGYEAGRLPLLAHALRATWQQRAGHQLTVEGYQATGGVSRAVATSAERVYRGLDGADQDLSRALLLRLTVIGDTGEDTRRRLARQELATWGDDPAAVDRLIETYTTARLLTWDQDQVEITHDALLRAWPRLLSWIDADRAGLRAAQEVEDAAVAWERADCDSSLLYRGLLLENAVGRLRAPGRHPDAPVLRSLIKRQGAVPPAQDAVAARLSRRASRFLNASIRLRRRVTRVRRSAIAALVALTLIAGTLAGYATLQRNQAVAAKSSAEFQQITAEAGKLSATNTSLSALLDVAAYRMRPTPGGFTSLLATEQQSLAADLPPGSDSKGLFDVSADGKLLAVSTNKGVRLWDISGSGALAQIEVPPSVFGPDVIGVSFSVTGRMLSVSSGKGGIRLWNLADPAHPTAEGLITTPPEDASNAAWLAGFGGPGTFIVGYQSTLQVWNVHRVRTPVLAATIAPPCGHPSIGAQAIETLSVNASGSTMVVGCEDGSAVLVAGASSTRPAVAAQFQVSQGGSVDQVAVDASGDQVAVAAPDDDTFQVWNIQNQSKPVKLNTGQYNDPVSNLAFIPGTPLLAVGDQEGTISLWDVGAPSAGFIPQGQTMQAGAGSVKGMAVTADGSTLVATYADDSIRIWHLPQTMSTNLDPFNGAIAMAVTPDGSAVAELKEALPGLELQVNPILSPNRLGSPIYLPQVCNHQLASFAFAPNGLLAAGCINATIQLWNIADFRTPRLIAGPLVAAPNGSTIVSMAFSPSGNILAVGSSEESSDLDSTIGLWDVSKPSEPELRQAINSRQPNLPVVAFADQGHILAATNSVFSIEDLWNITGYAATGEKVISAHDEANEIGYSNEAPILSVPRSSLLVSANNSDDLDVWNATEANKARLADQLSGDTDVISDASASHDGSWLVSTSYDETIRLWKRTGPDQFAPFGNPLNPDSAWETDTAFSPADDTFVTLSSTGDIYLWNLDVTSVINRICADTANVLTPSVWNKYLPGIPYQPPCG